MLERRHSSFTFYLAAAGFLWLKTCIVYGVGFRFAAPTFMEKLILWINPISSSLFILGLSFFFGKRLRGRWVLLISFISTMILYADLLYYRFYIDFVTVPVLFQIQNVGGLSASTLELISPFDLLLFVDLIILALWLKGADWQEKKVTKRHKFTVVIVALMLFAGNVSFVYMENPYLLKKFYNRETFVKAFGVFNYHAYDIFEQLKPVAKRALASNTDFRKIDRYVRNHNVPPNPDMLGIARGKNVILISLESVQNFVIGREVNGEEITPFLNDLIERSYYFDHFYHQTAQGKTSDAEFMVDNSLYPLSSGSVFVRYPNNTYNALPHILGDRGYTSVAFHGNTREFWNRAEMYETLGYDRFYSEQDYKVTEENTVNYGIKDIPFFVQSMPYAESLSEPFYAKFLTMTNHFPFMLDEEDELLEPPETDVGVVNRYFSTVRYTDEAVKIFFQKLKESGLYDNSIIVMYGDHYGISEAYEQGLEELYGKDLTPVDRVQLQRVPLIIHMPGQTEGETIHTVSGQIDIRPTLLHLLGIPTNDLIQFGHDLFSPEKKDFALFRDGGFVTDEYIFTANECFRKSDAEQVNIKKCARYFDRRSTELNSSDSILYEDLLKFER